jgi:hypothetical protein
MAIGASTSVFISNSTFADDAHVAVVDGGWLTISRGNGFGAVMSVGSGGELYLISVMLPPIWNRVFHD